MYTYIFSKQVSNSFVHANMLKDLVTQSHYKVNLLLYVLYTKRSIEKNGTNLYGKITIACGF